MIVSILEDIDCFLYAFKRQSEAFGMVVFGRDKNLQALLDLELRAWERGRIIASLKPEDYYRGPLPDQVREGLEYWEFGKVVKGKEVYIKLSLAQEQGPVVCLSFHPAERPIEYPYKDPEL